MPVHHGLHTDKIQFPVNIVILDHAGTAVGTDNADHAFYRTFFHAFHTGCRKLPCLRVKDAHRVCPGIALIPDHDRHCRRRAEIFRPEAIIPLFPFKGFDISGLFVKGDGEPVVLRIGVRAGHIRKRLRLPADCQTIRRIPHGGQICDKTKAGPAVARRCGLNILQRNLPVVLIQQDHAFL